MTSAQLAPAILIPFVAWRLYVRARRDVGRQQLRPARLRLRVALYGVICALAAYFSAAHLPALEAGAGGLVTGAVLAIPGLKLTRWEMTPEGNFYTPHAFLGTGLTLLLVGRIIYRGMVLFAGSPAPRSMPQLFQGPLTLAILGLTAGYSIAYAAGVLARGRHVA